MRCTVPYTNESDESLWFGLDSFGLLTVVFPQEIEWKSSFKVGHYPSRAE